MTRFAKSSNSLLQAAELPRLPASLFPYSFALYSTVMVLGCLLALAVSAWPEAQRGVVYDGFSFSSSGFFEFFIRTHERVNYTNKFFLLKLRVYKINTNLFYMSNCLIIFYIYHNSHNVMSYRIK